MNTALTPLPTNSGPVRADGAKWFIGYMPVSIGCASGEVEVQPLPPLPDFSVCPSWAVSTDPAFAANPFTGGFRTEDMATWSVPEEMPRVVEEEAVSYTDEDLQEVLAYLLGRMGMRIDTCPATDHARDAGIRFLLQEGLLIRSPMTTAFEGQAVAL